MIHGMKPTFLEPRHGLISMKEGITGYSFRVTVRTDAVARLLMYSVNSAICSSVSVTLDAGMRPSESRPVSARVSVPVLARLLQSWHRR